MWLCLQIDPTTYSNAMDSLAQAHSELEAKAKENRALNGRIREFEALQHKIDTNVCSVRPRMPAKADLKKYERAARGDGAEFEWVLVAQSKVREAPWHTDGAGRQQCRAHHRYIRGLGEISQTAYLRADNHTKLRNAHMSLSEVAVVVQAVFKTMIEASEAKLVIDVFWDHIQKQHTLRSSGYVQHANSPAAIQFAYCFLTSVEQLSFEPQIELFRGMMTGGHLQLASLLSSLLGFRRTAACCPHYLEGYAGYAPRRASWKRFDRCWERLSSSVARRTVSPITPGWIYTSHFTLLCCHLIVCCCRKRMRRSKHSSRQFTKISRYSMCIEC